MARAKKPAKKAAAKAKKAAPKKAAAKAAPKKKKPAAKPAKRAKAAAQDEGDGEQAIVEILEVLACPPSTADEMCEVCEDGIEAVQESLPHVAAAELVWRERPERAELAGAVTQLIEELQRHAQTLGQIYERLYPLSQDQDEHEDLDPAEVLERIRPLLEHHMAMEDAASHHSHGHDHDHDHPHDHDN